MNKRTETLIKDLIAEGYTIEELKKTVIKTLEPFFTNKHSLETYAFSAEILSTFSFLISYGKEDKFYSGLRQVLDIYNAAYELYPDKVTEMMISILENSAQKENQMWTVRENVPDLKLDKDFYDKVISYMKHIGDSLEISVKYIIIELYALLKLIEKDNINYEHIQKISFGNAVQNILDLKKLQDVLIIPATNLKVSDWRNIAYHHSYKVEKDLIICEYGKSKSIIQLTLTELEKQMHYIIRASNIFNIARCIFAFDNIEAIHNSRIKHSNMNVVFRETLLLDNFKISILSQGFEMLDCKKDEKSVIAYLGDLKEINSFEEKQKRIIHSSQLLFELWRTTKAEKLKIVYYDINKKLIAESSISGSFFETNYCKEDFYSVFIKNVSFTIL